MKNKIFYTTLAYWFLALGLVLFLSGCRTKKSKTDFKQVETETVSTLISENKEQKTLVTENEQKQETKSETDKSFFAAWLSFESDKITITDVHGNKTEIDKPKINKGLSQTNDVSITEQTDTTTEKVTKNEVKQQTDAKSDTDKTVETDLQESNSIKGKEPILLYASITFVVLIIIFFIYIRLKKK